MSADLHIHVIPNEPVSGTMFFYDHKLGGGIEEQVSGIVDEKVLSEFFGNTLGSRWFSLSGWGDNKDEHAHERAYTLISNTPSIWVGEVSWLKASLHNDESYIPEPVAIVADFIGEDLPVIDEELISSIACALIVPNSTTYKTTKVNDIITFLEDNKGLRCFTVSW